MENFNNNSMMDQIKAFISNLHEISQNVNTIVNHEHTAGNLNLYSED